MTRIAVLDDYQRVALTSADWSVLDGRATVNVIDEAIPEEDVVARLEGYDVICAMRERTKFPAEVLGRLPNLRLLVTTGMQNRSIDVGYARGRGVVVCGTGGASGSTTEHVWALILGVARHVVEEDAGVKSGSRQWQRSVPMGLAGKTLGLVGVGRLGTEVAGVAKVFGMHTLGWSPHLTRERAEAAGVELAGSKRELFERSDVVSVHMVSVEATRDIVGREELGWMKSVAYLVNTSRGPLVDEKALVDALREGRIAGAGLDVYDQEPLPLDHPLRALGNAVTLSPHIGYVSDSSYKTFFEHTVEDVVAYLDGKPVRVLQ